MNTLRIVIGLILCGVILGISSCQDQQTIDELAKFKQAETLKATNIALAKMFYKHLDAVHLDSLRELVAPDVKLYYQSGDHLSFSDIEPLIEMFYTSFPDYTHKIEDITAADDKVVCRILYTGTYTNPFMGMSPSGEKFRYKGIQIFQFSDGKVINFWGVEDELALMTQLGLELKPVDGEGE